MCDFSIIFFCIQYFMELICIAVRLIMNGFIFLNHGKRAFDLNIFLNPTNSMILINKKKRVILV